MDITGPITLELYASSSAVDTDFTAALVHVFPDGNTIPAVTATQTIYHSIDYTSRLVLPIIDE